MIHLHSDSGMQAVVSAVMFSTISHLQQEPAPQEGRNGKKHIRKSLAETVSHLPCHCPG